MIKDRHEENKEVEGYIPVCNLDMRAVEGNPQVPYYNIVHVIIGIMKLKTAKIDKYLVDRIADAVKEYIIARHGAIPEEMNAYVSYCLRWYELIILGVQRRSCKQRILTMEQIIKNSIYTIPLQSLEGILDTMYKVRVEGFKRGKILQSYKEYYDMYKELNDLEKKAIRNNYHKEYLREDQKENLIANQIEDPKENRKLNQKNLKRNQRRRQKRSRKGAKK